MKIQYYHSCVSNTQAAVAQSVVRRIGSAEVTGPIPVSSFFYAQKASTESERSLIERQAPFLYHFKVEGGVSAILGGW